MVLVLQIISYMLLGIILFAPFSIFQEKDKKERGDIILGIFVFIFILVGLQIWVNNIQPNSFNLIKLLKEIGII